MSRDYKSQKSSRSSSKKGGSAFLGGFVGYALGIMSAIGIWLYLNYAPSPYLSNDKNATATVKNETPSKSDNSELSNKAPSETPITVVEEKPRFDFYKILPGVDEPAVERTVPQRSVPPAPPPANTNKPQENVIKPVEKQPTLYASVPPSIRTQELTQSPQTPPSAPSTPKNNVTATKEKFFLQAGSFKTKGDAENLKARLALLGILASVQPIDLADKGTWHRVRVGPFTKKEDVDQTNASLKENGITAQFIKVQ